MKLVFSNKCDPNTGSYEMFEYVPGLTLTEFVGQNLVFPAPEKKNELVVEMGRYRI